MRGVFANRWWVVAATVLGLIVGAGDRDYSTSQTGVNSIFYVNNPFFLGGIASSNRDPATVASGGL
ncbi:MAG TPA: hypothetical protein VJR70_02265, partial [Stellaceae bacterium]|nr:hypothetical protein [Stellaceae bacterium]